MPSDDDLTVSWIGRGLDRADKIGIHIELQATDFSEISKDASRFS